MAKILRLHLTAQCALREITILQLKKLKKIFHCEDLGIWKLSFKIVSKLFQKNGELDVESELNHKKIGKMYMRQSFLHPTLKFLDYF
jgi:hypothetical protein